MKLPLTILLLTLLSSSFGSVTEPNERREQSGANQFAQTLRTRGFKMTPPMYTADQAPRKTITSKPQTKTATAMPPPQMEIKAQANKLPSQNKTGFVFAALLLVSTGLYFYKGETV